MEPQRRLALFTGGCVSPFSNHQRYTTMRNRTIVASLFTLALLLGLGLVPQASAQDVEMVPGPEPRPSPMAVAHTTLDDGTYVKVVFNQPHKRDRKIFGGLVPYGEVWRTGANEATELTTTGNLKIAGHDLAAGTYALFTIPGEDAWTIIVNGALGQWGAFNYNQEQDVMRFEVPASTMENQLYEAFTISFEDDGRLAMRWDQTEVLIPIEAAGSM